MDSKKLEMLVTTIDLGSFTKASEVVGYTQSGLTHMMDSLENEIGFPITYRGHGGVELNDNGKVLMPYIREFLKSNTNLDNEINKIKQAQSATIRVAAYASIAMHWLPKVLYSFRRMCPDVNVDLRMVDNAIEPYELLDQGKTDIIFASKQEVKGSYDWISLYEEPLCAILPKDYPIKGRTSFPLIEFEGKEFLMPYGKFDIDINKAFDKVGMKIQSTGTRVDDETVIRMVGHGLGVTIMSELMFRGRTENVLCVPVSPKCVRELGIGVKSNKSSSYAIRSLIDCVLKLIDELRNE